MSEQDKSAAWIFGQNVARLRKSQRLTQERLAEQIGIGLPFLQRIEYGERTASLHTVIKLRKALKCSWNDLYEGLEDNG